MDILLPVLRLVHIVCGVFWAGTIFFVAWLLEPSTRAAGPAGGQVMGELIKRGYLNIMPAMAALTIVSGGWLYWHVSGHLNSAWGHTPMGTSITVGAVAALVGFVLGMWKMRPNAVKLTALAGKMASASDAERPAIMAQMDALRAAIRVSGRWVAALLLVAVVGMAVARYL